MATEVIKLTPNVSAKSRVNEKIGVVWHHSAGSFNGSVDWILQSKSQVSYHCIINLNGDRVVFADDSRVCWHAGKSRWRGRELCNGFTIGVAFSGDTNSRSLTADEIASALEWLKPRWKSYGWDMSDMTTHRAVSPGRKDDISAKAEKQLFDAIRKELA